MPYRCNVLRHGCAGTAPHRVRRIKQLAPPAARPYCGGFEFLCGNVVRDHYLITRAAAVTQQQAVFFYRRNACRKLSATPQRCEPPAKVQEFSIELLQCRSAPLFSECGIQLRTGKGRFGLWVWRFKLPRKLRELIAAPPTDGINQLRIAVAHEIKERCGLAVILAHEQEWNVRRQQNEPRR